MANTERRSTPFDDPELSAYEYIGIMLESTDARGRLYTPASRNIENDVPSEKCRRIKISFNAKKAEAAQDWAEKAIEYSEAAAAALHGYKATEAEAKRRLKGGAFSYWKKYLSPFRAEKHAADSHPELFTSGAYVSFLPCAEKLISGEKPTDAELDAARGNIPGVSLEESRKIAFWYADILKELKERVGAGLYSRELILAARLFVTVCANDGLSRYKNECERDLAACMVIHKHARSCELADIKEFYAVDYDAIADSFYRPSKAKNGVKSLAPLYVYLILKEKPRCGAPLKQKEICDRLNGYGMCIERKAVARIINALCEQGLGIVKTPEGVYID